MLKRIIVNKKYIATIAISITGGIYAILGWISTFTPLDNIFPDSLSIFTRLLLSLLFIVLLWAVTFVVVSVILIKKKRYMVFSGNNGHKLFVQYGNLFSANEVESPRERRNVLIPVNRCFDVIVDNELISEKTLHGMALNLLYSRGIYNEEALNKHIQDQLSDCQSILLDKNQKPKGNRKRFPEGTVVDVPVDDNTHYILWALSAFDDKLKAHTSSEEYSIAVHRMIKACNLYSEGFPVVLPLVGTGLSRTKMNQNDVLLFLVNAFKLNRTELNCDIHIVVSDSVKEEISIMNIK